MGLHFAAIACTSCPLTKKGTLLAVQTSYSKLVTALSESPWWEGLKKGMVREWGVVRPNGGEALWALAIAYPSLLLQVLLDFCSEMCILLTMSPP